MDLYIIKYIKNNYAACFNGFYEYPNYGLPSVKIINVFCFK